MIDISMCSNDECPKAQKCYRFRAEPSVHQTVEFFAPGVDGICEEHIPYSEQPPMRTANKKPRERRTPARKSAA